MIIHHINKRIYMRQSNLAVKEKPADEDVTSDEPIKRYREQNLHKIDSLFSQGINRILSIPLQTKPCPLYKEPLL